MGCHVPLRNDVASIVVVADPAESLPQQVARDGRTAGACALVANRVRDVDPLHNLGTAHRRDQRRQTSVRGTWRNPRPQVKDNRKHLKKNGSRTDIRAWLRCQVRLPRHKVAPHSNSEARVAVEEEELRKVQASLRKSPGVLYGGFSPPSKHPSEKEAEAVLRLLSLRDCEVV